MGFLWANGVQPSTIDYLRDCFDRLTPVSQAVHETIKKLFLSYIVVGGMPEAVQLYVDTHDIAKVAALQTDILELYRLDISKYAQGNDKLKIRAIFDSKHAALDKVRKVKEWQAEKAYVFCQGNIEEEDGVTYLPWYEIMFLQLDRLPDTMKFEVDLSI